MPWSVEIADDSGTQGLSFWDDAYAEMSDKILLAPGSRIRARVSVGRYKNNLQLKLGRGQDLEFLQAQDSKFVAAPSAAPAPAARASAVPEQGSAVRVELKEISPALEGREVLIKGRVADIKAPEAGTKAPHEVVLKDGDIEIKVVYWDAVAARLSSNKPVIGALMQVEGTVSAYKEKLQVKVSRADKVGLLDSQPASVPGVNPSEVAPIGSITPALANQFITVRGTLGEPQSIRGGVKYPLSDDSGQTLLVLWDKRVQGASRNALKAGLRVVVSGLVVEYKGALEVVPQSDQAIQIEN